MGSVQPTKESLEQRWAEDVKGDKTPVMRECDKDAYVQMIEQEEEYRKIDDEMWGGNDFEVEWLVQEYMRMNRETLGWTQEQADMRDVESDGQLMQGTKEGAQKKSSNGQKNLWRRCERRAQTSRR